MTGEQAEDHRRLAEWFASCLDVDAVTIDDFGGIPTGHSAETTRLALSWGAPDGPQHRDVVIRLRPAPPGLLEPYDLRKQYDLLRALGPTPVRAPRVIGYEGTGALLGREFLAMDFAPGTVYEREVPDELANDPARVRRMSEELVDELARIHAVDTGALGFLGDGTTFWDREFAYWTGGMRRVQRGPLPVLERLLAELEARRPAPSREITIVHGDAKPGNFAFVGDVLSASFDWELTTLGDPMADVAYAQITWRLPGAFTGLPAALTDDELAARYTAQTGIAVHDLDWHRAYQGWKTAIILLLGAMLFDAGHSDDPRFAFMGYGIPIFTGPALAELGIDDHLDQGAVLPRDERLALLKGH
jgi:aminoglycoside phosphotransferase (APT) family kinase protein